VYIKEPPGTQRCREHCESEHCLKPPHDRTLCSSQWQMLVLGNLGWCVTSCTALASIASTSPSKAEDTGCGSWFRYAATGASAGKAAAASACMLCIILRCLWPLHGASHNSQDVLTACSRLGPTKFASLHICVNEQPWPLLNCAGCVISLSGL